MIPVSLTGTNPRIVFIAAMPREIAPLVNGWRADEVQQARGIHLFWNDDAVVACAGMGAHRASLAVEAALALGPASQLVSVGWAGSCTGWYHAGDVILANIVHDAMTGERYPTEETGESKRGLETIVTVAAPASTKEKARLGMSYYAAAVDMEAATVARIARAHELPFYAIKAISDDSDFELPDLSRFVTPQGQFREVAFGMHVAWHPRLWKPVLTMAKGSKLATGQLKLAMLKHIELYRTSRT